MIDDQLELHVSSFSFLTKNVYTGSDDFIRVFTCYICTSSFTCSESSDGQNHKSSKLSYPCVLE